MDFKLLLAVLLTTLDASPSMAQVGSSIGSNGVIIPKEDLKNIDGKQQRELRDQSTPLITRPGQPVSLSSRINQLEAEFREKIEEIKTQTSRSSEDQEEKIAIMKARERKQAQLLNQTREEMELLKTQNKDQSSRIDQLEQKLALLINTSPTSSAQTRENNKVKNGASNKMAVDQFPKALNPPSSCQELLLLNYNLDGLYLMKNKKTKKIQIAQCQFKSSNIVFQKSIGNVDVKTRSVHFYVQRNSSFSTRKDGMPIPFGFARLNEGEAMNLASGIFTAPVPGIYHFEFSGIKDKSSPLLFIELRLNGATVGIGHTRQTANGKESIDTVSLSASLRLKADDRVNLYNSGSGVLLDNKYPNHYTHFTGWLVEEDLM